MKNKPTVIEKEKSLKWKLEIYKKYQKMYKWQTGVWLPRHIKFLREYYLALSNLSK